MPGGPPPDPALHSEQSHPLVAALRAAANDLIARDEVDDVGATLQAIVAEAVETIPGVVAGGISVLEHGRIDSRIPTNAAVKELDELQSHLEEGPCITGAVNPADDGVIVAQDLAEPPDSRRSNMKLVEVARRLTGDATRRQARR